MIGVRKVIVNGDGWIFRVGATFFWLEGGFLIMDLVLGEFV